MDMMLRLEQNEYACDELLVSRESYANDRVELAKIETFAATYDPRDAIKCSPTDCFLSRLLNRSPSERLSDQRVAELLLSLNELVDLLAEFIEHILRQLTSMNNPLAKVSLVCGVNSAWTRSPSWSLALFSKEEHTHNEQKRTKLRPLCAFSLDCNWKDTRPSGGGDGTAEFVHECNNFQYARRDFS
jgi:hypothetical protein